MGRCVAHRREQEALTEALAVELQLRHWAQTVMVAASDGRCAVQHCVVQHCVVQRYVVQRWVVRHRLRTGVEREVRWAVDVRPGILRA